MAPQSGIQLSPYKIVCRQPFRATIGVGDLYISQEVKIKKNVHHLNQALAVMDGLACIRDLSPTGSLHPFNLGDEALLETWKTASPESRLEEKWTKPWDLLLTTPTAIKLTKI